MNIIIDIEQFDNNKIFYQDPVKNTVMEESNFIRTLYSNNIFTLNSIYIKFTLINATLEKYYNKYKCTFDINSNLSLINKLISIENDILVNFSKKNKILLYRIQEQISKGSIKIFTDDIINNIHEKSNYDFLLKISGIWETDTDLGITYKFINHQ